MNILMVGPHKDKVNGGMSTVIKEYTNSNYLKEFDIKNIHTVVPGSKVKKILYGLNSMVVMSYYLAFKKIDLVHIHTASGKSFFRKSIFIKIANKFNKKIILHIHGGAFEDVYLSADDSTKYKITQNLNKCEKIVVLSKAWKNKIEKMTDSEIVVINNSVNVNEDNSYNVNSKKILFIGRIEKDKGIFDFIEMARELVQNDDSIKFTICGDGELEQTKQLIEKYNLQDKFELLGWVSKQEVERELKDTMIFILPSYKEAMPMAILESMSCGVPTIATNVGSIPEVIKDMENGRTFVPGDIKNLVNITKEMIENQKLRENYSNKSFKDIKENYSNEVNHKKLKDLYLLTGGNRS
ncbi:glycosyltransferase family 4 protein [Paraclostridium tenue]|uniref:Glycosyltransferase family 4 protein n=1 Tax=Paraclostridium tenue TaxID=1737 RepID=A0ABP3X713_9FIRM